MIGSGSSKYDYGRSIDDDAKIKQNCIDDVSGRIKAILLEKIRYNSNEIMSVDQKTQILRDVYKWYTDKIGYKT